MPSKAKRKFWELLRPFYKFVKTTWVYKKLIKIGHKERQKYHVGWLKNHPLEHFVKHLEAKGFEYQSIAWLDPEEETSLRKRHNQYWQYHLRVYKDGEIRAHYEYAPEDYALRHFFEKNIQDRREEIHNFLSDHPGFFREIK